MFERFWHVGLLACEALEKIDWGWLAPDGAMTQALLGGEKIGPNPTDRGNGGSPVPQCYLSRESKELLRLPLTARTAD